MGPFQASALSGPGSVCFCTVGSPELPCGKAARLLKRSHGEGVAMRGCAEKGTTVPVFQLGTAHQMPQMTTLKRAEVNPVRGGITCK